MITEDKKYLSSVLKTFGFAFFAPIESLFFQLLVFKKNILDGYLIYSLLASSVGALFLNSGYNIVKEET